MTILPDRDELQALAAERHEPSVSIFLPIHRDGLESARKDPVRLRDRLRDAREQLVEHGARPGDVDALLAEAHRLARDDGFWQEPGDGLAMFVADGATRWYRLPFRVPELSVVAGRFHLKPILPALGGGDRFYILALSQQAVQLYEADPLNIRELGLPGSPANVAEAVGDQPVQKGIQFHTLSARSGSTQRRAMFHGHGEGTDDRKDEIARFFRLVDAAVVQRLADRAAPLVLAAVEYEIALYREVSKHPNVAAAGVEGNPETLRPEELHGRALRIVAPAFETERQDAFERFGSLLGAGRASAELGEVLPAIADGRVDALFVALDTTRRGRFDVETREVAAGDAESGDEDLLDLAASMALQTGSAIHAVPAGEVPGGGSVAAIFRY